MRTISYTVTAGLWIDQHRGGRHAGLLTPSACMPTWDPHAAVATKRTSLGEDLTWHISSSPPQLAPASPPALRPPSLATWHAHARQVQAAIGAKNAVAFDLTAACSGFVLALVTAAQFVNTGVRRNVLVVGGDAMSRIVDWRDRGACFGGVRGGGIWVEG
jgi:hypothetical protein